MAYNKKNTPMSGEIDISALCVADRLKTLRNQYKLTQEDLATVLNVSPREYWRYEQKNYCTRYSNLLALSLFYNVSLDYLFGLTNEQRTVYSTENYTGSFSVPGLQGMILEIPNVEEFKKRKAFSKIKA